MQTLKAYVIVWLLGFFVGGVVGAAWTLAAQGPTRIATITTPAATPGFEELDPWVQQVFVDVYEAAVASGEPERQPKSWKITDLVIDDRYEEGRREISCIIGSGLSDPGFRLRLFIRDWSLPVFADEYNGMMFHPIVDMSTARQHRTRIAQALWGDDDSAIDQLADELIRYRHRSLVDAIYFAHSDENAREHAKIHIKLSRYDMRRLMPSLDKLRWTTSHRSDGTYFHSTEASNGSGLGLEIVTNGFGEMVEISASY